MKTLAAITCIFATVLASEEFISGNNLLTADIYKELTETLDGNFLVSPFSVQTVLALLQSGARGTTAEEIRSSLRLPNTKEEIERSFATFLPKLRNEEFVLESANKIYVKEKYPISEEFKKSASVYEADWEEVNFEEREETAGKINSWVENKTKEKIHDIISPFDLAEGPRLVLINALYFKGNWSFPFYSKSTTQKDFHKTETEVVQVETMHAEDYYNYYECSQIDAKFLELPFEGGDASLTIVLPNEKNGIKNLENNIDKVFIRRHYKRELVVVALPKFKIETSIDFVEILKELGVKKVFSEQSDLSGITTINETLAVSKILQKTFIDVSEPGVEAAAATIVEVNVIDSVLEIEPVTPKYFIADHPFIFYIKVRGLILFGGRLVEPNL